MPRFQPPHLHMPRVQSGVYTNSFSTFALCGQVRAKVRHAFASLYNKSIGCLCFRRHACLAA